jgi:hypothetical protein
VGDARPDYADPTAPTVSQGDSVTSPPQPTPGEGKSAGQYLRPLRDLAAYALVGAPAVLLLVAVIRMIPGGSGEFEGRTMDSFYGFINVPTIFFPLAAVLLALLVQPRHPKAPLIVLAAVIEYAVMAFFGVVFGLLIGLINHAVNTGARYALEELLIRVAWLAVFAVAAYALFQIWRNMFYTPKPKAPPNVYGQPQYGAPGAYPGQPGYGPPPGQPGYGPPPGQPGYGPPPGQPGFPPPGQPGFPPPGQPQPGPYGQPQAPAYGQPAPSWNQPPVPLTPTSAAPAPASAPPAAAPPGPFAPQPGHAQGAAPYAAFSEPTQAVPRTPPPPPPADRPDNGDDRTEMLRDDRPGFGPADGDQPRH